MGYRLWVIGALLALSLSAYAWDYQSQESDTTQSMQLRVGAQFTKKWHNGLRLSLSEDMRFDLYHSANGAAFNRSYTTLTLGYSPIEYVKLDAGYTLKLLGNKGWTDVNEFLRHRVFFGVTGAYHMEYAKIYLRERALCEMRTDSVNPLEKNQYDWLLRSRIGAEFYVPGKPVKPYLWAELENTLNVPEYQQKNGRQYISSVRTQIGVKWRVSRLSSLDFYYRFQYDYDRDINITKKKSYIELTEERSFQHAIGITYNLDW